jgi:hypothetical protein
MEEEKTHFIRATLRKESTDTANSKELVSSSGAKAWFTKANSSME